MIGFDIGGHVLNSVQNYEVDMAIGPIALEI
jgi:hypothetical protein